MCIVFFEWDGKAQDGYKLVLAANRDEEYNRPSSRAGWWDACPQVLGGTDLQPGNAPYVVVVALRWKPFFLSYVRRLRTECDGGARVACGTYRVATSLNKLLISNLHSA
jgi:hypothetical protein